MVQLAITNATLISDYGAPQQVWVRYDVDGAARSINMTVFVVNKTATRLPETLWIL